VLVLFNSLIFLFLFLPITYVVFWNLRTANARYVWLTLTGYVFYGYWDVRFCFLMAFSTLVSYTAGLGLLRFRGARARLLCLVVPVSVDLLLLGFFKYVNFLLDNLDLLARALGRQGLDHRLDVVLPVGISFYTFHTITYIVDCYRGVVRPTRNPFEFGAYVSLFSQLVAGPIVRFRQIEEDLENLGKADRGRWLTLGISFFVWGLVEKVLLADSLAAFVDPAWKDYRDLSTAGAWLAVLGYSFQLYFDFSGYSTMAVGLGYAFGLRIPQNFNSPYKAVDPSDFWQRWHISLSACLRDYLYIPLGGNRHGTWATYRNLMITMLLGGLWHGANWTFVIWGAYHGLLLILYRLCGSWWGRLPAPARRLGTFLLVVVGWVFFRADSVTIAVTMLATMFTPVAGPMLAHAPVFAALVAVALAWAMVGPNAFDWHKDYHWDVRTAYVVSLFFGAALALIVDGHNSPFLYFQF
jgi:alginate O-acetyltransferase complex protein AlgI